MTQTQADMFKPPVAYEVVLRPPAYPSRLFPRRCQHDPQFVMSADVRLGGVGRDMEIDHSVCLACGSSLPSTYGGNIFVDLHMLWEELGWHAEIGARIIFIRGKWAKIATYLFTSDGWNGRHERVARIIDPRLTMKLDLADAGHGLRLGTVSYDADYRRWADEDEA